MEAVGVFEVVGDIGIITIDNPPVNALGARAREALCAGFGQFAGDDQVKAIVLRCAGRTFFAGADIAEFGKPPVQPDLPTVLEVIEQSRKPVIAAIHGTALGGGYELALVCHYRIAARSAKVGLPEVKLGLLPGAGGTQRLPRIVGVPAALEIIAGGAPVPAPKALELGMIDAMAEDATLREEAIAFAQAILAAGQPLQRVRDRQDMVEPYRGQSAVYDDFLSKNAKAFRGFRAPLAIVEAVRAAADLPFEQGLQRERQLFEDLRDGTQSAAQRYYFFAERQTVRIPDVPADTTTRPVRTVGVIGAGTMGGGIAMNFLNVGIPVTLVDMSQDGLDRGIAIIRRNYETTAKKGRLTAAQVEQRMALLTPSLSLESLAGTDLVIEAVFEEMQIKKDLFAKLDAIVPPGTILASNTSYLDLNAMAAATSRPQDVVGMHFFSPANVMRLLEVVQGRATAKDVMATVLALAKTIGKVPVVSGVCHGFIANRAMATRRVQAEQLVLEGPTPQDIDQAMVDYGFAMGPFQMNDLVGLDVTIRGQTERSLRGDLVAMGRLGQKTGAGFYDYDEQRAATPSAVTARVIADFAAYRGVTAGGRLAPEEIVARLLYVVVNEGARILEEGMAIRASDIDVACILGYNWPVYTGGPMFWGDTVGLDRVVAGLKAQGIEPARLLVEKVARGERITG